MYRICLSRRGNFGEWRDAARRLLQAGIAPHEVDWCLESEGGLFAAPDRVLPGAKPAVPRAVVPASFPELAEAIVCHSDPGSFALLYRLLHRLQSELHLLSVASDADVVQAGRLAKSVRRDCHKMTAFVRFRELAHPGEGEQAALCGLVRAGSFHRHAHRVFLRGALCRHGLDDPHAERVGDLRGRQVAGLG